MRDVSVFIDLHVFKTKISTKINDKRLAIEKFFAISMDVPWGRQRK